MSPGNGAALREGDRLGKYQSRSEVLRALLVGMVNAHWEPQQMFEALMDPGNAGGAALRTDRKGRPLPRCPSSRACSAVSVAG